MEAALRKESLKEGEKNENLSSRMKIKHAKAVCDELVKKLKIKQRGVFFIFKRINKRRGCRHGICRRVKKW